jgi:hypothetical protein
MKKFLLKIHAYTVKKFSSLLAPADGYTNNSNKNKNNNLIIKLNNRTYVMGRDFLEWFVGFTDADGNFNISLRKFKDNKYNSVLLTFQIGLHIDDLELLKFIQRKLNCGHISISGSKCNYFVNDQASLIHVISPIFNHVQLNSTKYFDFLTFDKAVNLVKNKEHLSPKGKLKIIEYYHEMKNEKASNSTPSGGPQGPRRQGDIHISDY